MRVLGPDHPDTLITRHDLARGQADNGDTTGAVAAFRDLLPDMVRVLGPDHPDTLTTRHNLGYWRGTAGDPAGAATDSPLLLMDQPRKPGRLATRANLAQASED